MKRIIIFLCLITISSVFFFDVDSARAARSKYLFKIASLAPDGSVWAKRFSDFTEEVKEKSNGEIDFKIYAGGVMGDDRSMYRKMRVGQIQAGGFTMTGIGEVVNDFRVLGIPFLFKSYSEVDYVVKGLTPMLEKAFDEKNLVMLYMTEVGFLYGMSTVPMVTVDDLKKSKSWVPEGDPISRSYLKEIGVSPIPLAIPDVLTSLQTGLIDTVYNSFYGSIVLQWFTRTKYISDVPFAYSYGAIVFDKRSFSKLPDKYVTLMKTSIKKHFDLLLEDTRKSNAESLNVLKKNGMKLVEATPKAKTELIESRDKMIDKLVGTAFSQQIYDKVQTLLIDFRSKQTAASTKQKPLVEIWRAL